LALLSIVGWLGITPFVAGTSALYAQEITPKAIPESSQQVTVSSFLNAQLATGSNDVPILILLKVQPDLALLKSQAVSVASTNAALSPYQLSVARRTYLYHALTTQALQSQASLRAWLTSQGISYRAHYITNMIRVSGGKGLADALRQRPDVAHLDADPEVDELHLEAMEGTANSAGSTWARLLPLSQTVAQADFPSAPAFIYGLNAIHAPEVWAMGYTGQGITVASQDTGVQWDHPALRAHYRGVNGDTVNHTYNWLDAIPDNGVSDPCEGSLAPCDDYGHGTHTVGTMVGETSDITYGVAPGAQWIGCRNMRHGVGSPESYTTCFEFFMAPYPPNGDPFRDGKPELAPDIINNSWGCPPSEGCNKESLLQVVETVRAAGLMVVASAGNNGANGCSTVVDPIAIYDATFSVGAVDSSGILAGFSSRGPVTADGSGRLKPDLTAPGVDVLSTYYNGGTTTLSGTSMASPHVAGAVALLWSAASWLRGNPDLTEQVLLKSATPVYSSSCTNGGDPVSPNPAYGYGRLDAEAAVKLGLRPWTVEVSIVDPSGVPVTGAQAIWIDARTGYTSTATSDVAGNAVLSPLLAGTYTLKVQEDASAVEVDNLQLTNPETNTVPSGVQLSTAHFTVLFDKAVVHFPARHYMPGIFFNQ
jgi:subtilisin family serine protease